MIIIEPIQNAEKFFSDTVGVYKAIKSSVIAKAEITDIRHDLRRKVVIIEIKSVHGGDTKTDD